MDKILIVSSSERHADFLCQSLEGPHYETQMVKNGAEALAQIATDRPDLIVLDTHLPDMTGFDVCKSIKMNHLTKMLPVLMVGSAEAADMRARAMQAGAVDFTAQTADCAVIVFKIQSLLRLKYLDNRRGIEYEKQYIETEERANLLKLQLKMGRSVQRSILPKINMQFNQIKLYSKYMPALDIGGDFYNIVRIDDTRLCIVIGDVSGFGISAALLTSMLYQMVISLVEKYTVPDQLLHRINNDFYKIFENSPQAMYACMFCAVIDTDAQMISCANAGEPQPIYINAAAGTAHEIAAFGSPIGLMRDVVYDCLEMPYSQNDLLMFYTDGLADALYKESPGTFAEKVKDVLLGCYACADPAEIVDTVLRTFYKPGEIKAGEKALDDVSIILCLL